MTTEIKIEIYRVAGTWYGSIWINGEYDSNDPLPVDPDATEDEAREAAEIMPLIIDGQRTIVRGTDGK